jgi:phosphatidylinositol alpha-mannosyltransferase
MKIALVSPYEFDYPGGVGRHVAALACQFREGGHQVGIIAPGSGDNDDKDDGIFRIGRVTPVPANGSIARITLSLRMVRRIKDILASQRFDIVHVHEPLMPALSPTVLRYSQAVNIGTFHAFRHSYYGYRYGRPLLKLIMNKLEARIAVSRVALGYVSQYFPGTYTIIPNGVDLRRFRHDVAPIERYCDGRINILFVGRWEKRKGLTYLIRAYELLRGDFPQTRILVVGPEGRHSRSYREYVELHGLRGIEFVGPVADDELPRYYRTCDIFCAPSTRGESFGMILPEAMASGRPIVTTDIEGYRDIVVHGEQGLLVPPRDQYALANALAYLITHPAERERMAQAGLHAAQNYSWERIGQRVLSLYGEVLEGRRSLSNQPSPLSLQQGLTLEAP